METIYTGNSQPPSTKVEGLDPLSRILLNWSLRLKARDFLPFPEGDIKFDELVKSQNFDFYSL